MKFTLAKKVATVTFVLAAACIIIAFFTNYWLESDYLLYGAEFKNLGLWVHCFRSLEHPYRPSKETYFVGCRWLFNPFTTGYREIRDFLAPPFFVAVQVFFTLCFMLALVSIILFLMLILCFARDDRQILILKLLTGILFASAACGFIAVIIFAVRGDGRDWMPRWKYNHLSWSFALGVVGVAFELIAAALFFTEKRIQQRKQKLRDEGRGVYSIEQKT